MAWSWGNISLEFQEEGEESFPSFPHLTIKMIHRGGTIDEETVVGDFNGFIDLIRQRRVQKMGGFYAPCNSNGWVMFSSRNFMRAIPVFVSARK